MLSGFAERIAGETIVYHSPDPEVRDALLVRSLDERRGIEWLTTPVPDRFDGEAISFVWMFALQVDPARHRFTLQVEGEPWCEFRTPATNEVRDWTIDAANGASLRFRATMVDRFNDLMGYAVLRVPRSLLKPGKPLRLGVAGETANSRAWYITFQAPVSESASLTPLPALVRAEPCAYQPIVLSITHVGEPTDATITTSYGTEERRRLELGGNLIALRHPAVEAPTDIEVRISLPARDGGRDPRILRITLDRVRPWSIDLVQHTHTDVGYTRPQTEILPEQVRFLDTALDYCDKTDGYPDAARFRWTCETSWAVREFLRTRSPVQIERLRRRAAEGRIEVTGMFLNMSEIVDEASFGAFLEPIALARRHGLPVTTAVQNDVNGVAWCLVDALPGIGVDYLIMGQHGHRALMPFDRPTSFWWESKAGRRVLAFRADHYHTGNFWGVHTGNIEAVESELLRYLVRLDRSGYPFDRIAVEHSGYPTDNAPPSTASSDLVRRWNDTYLWPQLRCATAREFPEFVRSHHADELPVVRGAWTDWWTDGFGSAARETAMARVTQGRLAATEGLLAMQELLQPSGGSDAPPNLRSAIDEVRDALLFWGEHTMGSAESIREPLCENSVIQWAEKAAYAWEAVKDEAALEEAALGRFEFPSVRGGDETRLAVLNTLPFARSGLLELYADHELLPVDRPFRLLDEDGRQLAVQRLRSRAEGSYWAIWARDVPAFGWRTFRLADDAAGGALEHAPARRGDHLENGDYRLRFDSARGAIESLVDLSTRAELVDPACPWGMGGLIHERLGNREQLEGFRLDDVQRTGLRDVRIEGIDDGPIWSSLRFRGELPGCGGPGGVSGEIRLFHVAKRIELHYALAKERDFEPEGIYVAFPFALPGGQIGIETLGAVIDPATGIIPGASSDWQAMQGFASVRNASDQIVVSSNEIPLLQCGGMNLGAFRRQARVDVPHLYSWVMNNYWTTNFCAGQEGEFRFHYALTSGSDGSDGCSTRFGCAERVPLLGRVLPGCRADAALESRSLLAWSDPDLILIAARPVLGGGILLHVRHVGAAPATLDTGSWRFGDTSATVREANALEEPVGEASSRFPFRPYETKWLLVRR